MWTYHTDHTANTEICYIYSKDSKYLSRREGMVISEQILSTFIGFGIGIMLYLVITSSVNKYLWWKLKRHVIEAVEALDLWDAWTNMVSPGTYSRQSLRILTHTSIGIVFMGVEAHSGWR